MSGVTLRDYQDDALGRMKNGCILNGGVGSGKSRTSLAYYYTLFGGQVSYYKKNLNTGRYDVGPFKHDSLLPVSNPTYIPMTNPPDLYIITTAQKRDKLEWEGEMLPFHMSTHKEGNLYSHKIVVDSWNNIDKYSDVKNSFFIFDEQRLIGNGVWVKTFYKIAKANQWILLSATPGDKWEDYIPVFVANGFYKNRTDFCRKHVVYNPFTPYVQIQRYVGEGYLNKLRNHILIDMDFKRDTIPHHEHIIVSYDADKYNYITKYQWNIYKDKPIDTAAEYCIVLRQLVNSDKSRQEAVLDIIKKHPKAIIFYNHDYELEILRTILADYPHAEWNGHKHEPLPTGDKWAYFVQYTAGCEGWNCITTDTTIFYSQNYSYKVMQQASGRIDRLNTPFKDLYYYHLRSESKIDNAIRKSLKEKKKFNEKGFAPVFAKAEKEKPEQVDIHNYVEVTNSWD